MPPDRFPLRQSIQHVAVVNFTGDRANWGCQATSWELLLFLQKAFRWGASTSLTLVPLLPRHAVDRDIDRTEGAILRSAMGEVIAGSKSDSNAQLLLRIARQRFGPWVDRLAQADVVFFQPEGTMAGVDFVRGLRLLLLPVIAKHIWRKPVYSLNQTLFSADDDFTTLMRDAFRSFDLVACRETASYAFAREIGLQDAILIPDFAFNTQPVESNLTRVLDPNARYFCLTGSAHLSRTKGAPRLVDLASRICDRTGLKVIIAGSTGSDLGLAEMARDLIGDDKVTIIKSSMWYQEFAEVLRQCEFMLGGRYHSAITAAAVGTPYIPVRSNSYKSEGLNALLDWPFAVRDVDDGDGILSDVDRLWNERESYNERLANGMNFVRDRLSAAEQWLAAAADGNEQPVPDALMPVVPQSLVPFSEIAKPYVETTRTRAVHLDYPNSAAEEDIMGRPVPVSVWAQNFNRCVRRSIDVSPYLALIRALLLGSDDRAFVGTDTRTLVSLCDSFVDHGDPIESRNAMLVSQLVAMEKLAQTYVMWLQGSPGLPVPENEYLPKGKLWDGMTAFHLVTGDATNNLFRRLFKLIPETPHIERLFRLALDGIRNGETILAALNSRHGHVFETDFAWAEGPEYAAYRTSGIIPPWKVHSIASNSDEPASKQWLELSAKHKRDLGFRFKLAEAYMTEHRLPEAEAALMEAIELRPEKATGYLRLARLMNDDGRRREAVDVLRGARERVEAPDQERIDNMLRRFERQPH